MRKNDWLKNVLITILVTVFVVCVNMSLETKAQAANIPNPLPINRIFPDPDLAERVKETLKKSNVTDVVSQRELDEVQIFNGNGRTIISIDGLQYFTNLKELYLSRNHIRDLTPLKDLTNLAILCLDKNRLENLNGIPSNKLVRLSLEDNELTQVDALANLTQLETLFISKNQLKNIDALANLTNLKTLDLNRNELEDLSPLARLENLTSLDLANQKCVKEALVYKPKLVIPNTIKGPDKVLITPSYISDNGSYTNGQLKWNLPVCKEKVCYTFAQLVRVGKTEVVFNGVVIQPLYPKKLETKKRASFYLCGLTK
ncbi:leucine-rich repeat domain-containing protein [Listeria ivanovii]|uniref:leucine-rich repeat domain-containing protein n=1 Tax=Listeria ivanovii TaxID=1638 RepID=UPI0035185ECF